MLAPAAIVSLAFLAAAAPARGQWSAGLHGGISRATFIGSDLHRADWTPGGVAGAVATRHLVDELSFQVELTYARRGGDVTAYPGSAASEARVTLDYVEVPAMFRLDFTVTPDIGIHALGGPYGAMNVACRVVSPGNAGARTCAKAPLDMGVHTFDVGLQGGIGVDFGRTRSVFLDGRYQVGLRTIDDGASGWNRTNSAFTLLTGVRVPVGGDTQRIPTARRSHSPASSPITVRGNGRF